MSLLPRHRGGIDWWEFALTLLALSFASVQLVLFPTCSSVIAVALLAIATIIRRRRPLTAVGVAVVGLVSSSVAAGPSLSVWSGLLVWTGVLVVLFSVTLTVPPLRSAIWTTAVIGIVYLSVVFGPAEFVAADGLGLAVAPWTLSVWGVAATVRAQRRATEAVRDRLVALQQLQDEEIHHHVVEERLRIARELHDELAHQVAVISMNSGAAEAALTTDPKAASRSLRRVRESSRRVLAELQAILGVLRTDERPAPTVEGLLDDATAMGITIEGEFVGVGALAPDQADVARRVLQEVLTNARRYGDGHLVLQSRYERGRWRLTATNRVHAPRTRQGSGYGLAGMRERVQGAGGSVGVQDDGTLFALSVDLPREGFPQ